MPIRSARRPVAMVRLYSSGPHNMAAGSTRNTGTPTTPVRRRVRLHDQPSGRVVRETWSDPATGAYQFSNLPAGTYYVTAFDHTGLYNGEIATDIVLPAPGA